ncbi:MAG: bifunctional diaminohydroxyphosphoribosylaminopyrimidine deaminase/5-amino-6-(5-phosphoribosylamino)uracil reductase RibD [Lentisphaerae bacterium]|jgi:diaminohydroxyphosphoribosylaminopyrimidine deaminase/5-amino-6-(5-phosphoribosylamino)uracil reductase|nr:bifunctional diaminohydroxyphosphoribosylaminopyrimidine deaminase/5-amino-6-(5-phosphoribosylamino)uracil reductase RibD [Lentisphaerota bacterium]
MENRTHTDEYWMRLALIEAEKGWGLCSPNPMVGAVVVKDGEKIGIGYHHRAGEAHAEVLALREARAAAQGADLFVTLEPCCTQGRTPPCVEAILRAGIRRVVIGCLDQNPAHGGRGVTILREAGLEVVSGVLEEDCLKLNEHFFWWINQRRPFVYLKMAMSLDGKIALPDGSSKWITGLEARRQVQRLRQLAGAIMVGGKTARQDNPGLRVIEPPDWPRQPQVCIWSSRLLESDLRIVKEATTAPILCKPTSQAEWVSFLQELGQKDCTFLLLEGGGELAAAALGANIVNKVGFFVAPKLILGRDAIPVTGGKSVATLAGALSLDNLNCERFGQDLLITGYCEHVYRNH